MTDTKRRTSNKAGSRPAARAGVASKELQEARRKKRQREVMRNRIIFGAACLIVLFLIIFIIVKIVGMILGSGQIPDASTLTFNEDGTVVFEEVAEFGDDYSKSDLKSSTQELISSFNEAYGSDAITLDKIKVKGDVAYVKTTYVDADAYASFTTYTCFNDTVENATEAGYDFNDVFAEVTDGVKGDTVDYNSADDFAGYYVAMVQENVNVVVPGDIAYVSDLSTDVIDGNTVSITPADGNEDASDLVYIIYSVE